MPTSTSLAAERLALAPMGAGDLLDRTIRLYRRHFLTLLRTAAPPVVIAAVGSVLWVVCFRAIPLTASGVRLALYVMGAGVGLLLWISGPFFLLVVLGGASRNLVAHLLWQEPVSARTVYRNVRARFWGLFSAMLLTALCAFVVGSVTSGVCLVALVLTVGVVEMLLTVGPVSTLMTIIVLSIMLLYGLGALLFFFWVMGHLAYVPQVMMIEGQGVFDAVGRSVALARGNARRLLAMFLFTTFATYSALMLLLIPPGWYVYLYGIDLTRGEWPVWYSICGHVMWQVSTILLMPVWMLGLSLLYVDERVRHEGYDIELLARQQLGEMPQLPDGRVAPLAPALVKSRDEG